MVKAFILSGIANATGFQIYDFRNEISIKTRDYHETKTNLVRLFKIDDKIRARARKSLKGFCLFYFPSLILRFFVSQVDKIDESRRRNDRSSYLDNQTYEWHSCEHKLIWIIENNKKEVSLEVLRHAPCEDKRCGSGKKQRLYLKEPSQEKLEETLRVAKEYYQKMSG